MIDKEIFVFMCVDFIELIYCLFAKILIICKYNSKNLIFKISKTNNL